MSKKVSKGQLFGSNNHHHGNNSGFNSTSGAVNTFGAGNGSNSGYRQRNYGDERPNGKAHLFCDFFHFKGHTRESCYKLHGYPNKKGTTSNSYANNW